MLKLLKRKDIISFGGGMPNPLSFPSEIIRKFSNEILKDKGSEVLQYGITEGLERLAKVIKERIKN